MRLLCLFSPKCLILLLLVGGGGYSLISFFGESQVAEFSMNGPYRKPMEGFIKEWIAGEYSSAAIGWAFSTLAFLWGYIGRQLKRAESF